MTDSGAKPKKWQNRQSKTSADVVGVINATSSALERNIQDAIQQYGLAPAVAVDVMDVYSREMFAPKDGYRFYKTLNALHIPGTIEEVQKRFTTATLKIPTFVNARLYEFSINARSDEFGKNAYDYERAIPLIKPIMEATKKALDEAIAQGKPGARIAG